MVKAATKTCRTCHACKPVALFNKNQCKACVADYQRKYRQKHMEKIKAKKREYHQQNKEEIAAKRREYYQKNKEEIAAIMVKYYQQNKEKVAAKKREYRQENKEEIAAYQREYHQKNKEKLAAKRREYYQKNKEEINARSREYKKKNKDHLTVYYRNYVRTKRQNDPKYNLISRLRTRMNGAVKAAGLDKKCASTIELLGISTQGLKEWLEAQFTEGMTWENRSDWHVDHRVPCDAFDLTVDQNQRICFWYKNLQPLWAEENIQKSNAYTEEEKQALISAYCNQ